MNKKKILWIGDDIRMHSGVSTMGREMIFGSVHKFDFCCIGGAIQHPEKGKAIDLSQAVIQVTGVKDARVTIYPQDGYGNEEVLFNIIEREKPDAICIITDPRFFGWLFAIERQIRGKIPICYWNIWDSTPSPMYNHASYESCDLLMGISKQTYNINKIVLGNDKCFTFDGEFDKEGKTIPFKKEKE